MRPPPDLQPVHVPSKYPTSIVYIDESGTASNGRVFVAGAVKVRSHGQLFRTVRALRDRRNFRSEFRFNRIGQGNLDMYQDLVDLMIGGDTVFFATVVDRQVFDPAHGGKPRWRAHADVTAQLLSACINQRELVTATMDLIDTPEDVAMEDEVRRRVHQRLRSGSLVSAACHDSRSTDGLQLADLVAGAVAYERRRLNGGKESMTTPKGQLVEHLKRRLNVADLQDVHTRRLSILTLEGPRRGRADVTPLRRKARTPARRTAS